MRTVGFGDIGYSGVWYGTADRNVHVCRREAGRQEGVCPARGAVSGILRTVRHTKYVFLSYTTRDLLDKLRG